MVQREGDNGLKFKNHKKSQKTFCCLTICNTRLFFTAHQLSVKDTNESDDVWKETSAAVSKL